LDEIEIVLGIKRDVAKEIIKLRVKKPLDEASLISIKGIGPKALEKAKNHFHLNLLKINDNLFMKD